MVPENFGWRLYEHLPEETTKSAIVKRRRLRKRKRRPQPLPSVDSFDRLAYEEQLFQRRNRRPQRLDEYKHRWDVMEVENVNKPYTRRRIAPDYFSSSRSGNGNAFVEEKPASDLKSVLKKTEGTLSLSEVLQQKNLTLADLLKGNHDAISALTGSSIKTEYKNPVEVPYKSLYNSHAMIRVDDSDNENKLNRISAEVNAEQNETKLPIPVIYKPNLESNHMIHNILTTTQSSSTVIPKRQFKLNETYKKTKNKLPITSAKLHKLTTEKPEDTDVPPKAVEIKLSDLFGFSDYIKSNNSENPKEEPEKMTINLDQISIQNDDSLTSTPSKSIPDKLTIKTAKEEIMEFLNNKENQANLTDILKTRNMTTEELVALRERGSSQRHLADIFHNKTREPEPTNEAYTGEVTNLKSFPFNRKPKTTAERNDQDTKQFATTERNDEFDVTVFPAIKIETKENPEPKIQPFHVWKTYAGNIGDEHHESNNKKDPEEMQRIDEIENALAAAVNEKLNVEINENLYEEEAFLKWPTGIKSAIFASLVIIGASLLIFLSILIIFRWTQKTRQRFRQRNSFAASKIRFPILEEHPKRNIRTIMCETLGRKKEAYKSKQSMSDSIWDGDKRPFQ